MQPSEGFACPWTALFLFSYDDSEHMLTHSNDRIAISHIFYMQFSTLKGNHSPHSPHLQC